MFQKFSTESLFTNFIKHLLETSNIPTLQCIYDDFPVIKGCSYLYNNNVVKITRTKLFDSSDRSSYEVVGDNTTYRNFISNVSYYDESTHKELGNYLRHLRDTTGLDLMSYYNCYNGKELHDMYLRNSTVSCITVSNDRKISELILLGSDEYKKLEQSYQVESNDNYRVVAVPIRYDTKYTVALSSPFTVSVRAVIYNQGNVAIDKTSKERHNLKSYYSDYLSYTFKQFSFTDFDHPFTYEVPLATQVFHSETDLNDTVRQELYNQQDNLYLLLQLPVDTVTSIVVMEKSFREEPPKVFSSSLLTYNTGFSYAFSDRLIEYLCMNVISSEETLTGNIRRVQDALCKLYPEYKNKFTTKKSLYGVWDADIKTYILKTIENNSNWIENPLDQDGHINKDIEQLLSNIGAYKT